MPKLSIITVNLNDANGLLKTLKSIIFQKFTDFELIVIDGGSEDNSIDIIKQFQGNIAYWISEPDTGIYHAMNKGILEATGLYCFFLNSGDLFVNEHVLNDVFKKQIDADIIFGNLIVYDRKKQVLVKWKEEDHFTFLDIYFNIIRHQASFIKRSLFDRYGLYNEDLKIVADTSFFMKTLGTGDATAKYVDVTIARFDSDGISNQYKSLVINEKRKILEDHLPFRIREDYFKFIKFSAYFRIANYRFATLLLRALNRCVKIYERFDKRRQN